ncbi:hypothetical protein KKF91_06445 [Myxococcota bacterium]|nr:hypothetical protein [Myxococcota bacterium]
MNLRLLASLLFALPFCATADEPPEHIGAPLTYPAGQPSPHPLAKPLPDPNKPLPRRTFESGSLITNGSFEAPALGRGAWKPLPSIPGWVC